MSNEPIALSDIKEDRQVFVGAFDRAINGETVEIVETPQDAKVMFTLTRDDEATPTAKFDAEKDEERSPGLKLLFDTLYERPKDTLGFTKKDSKGAQAILTPII